MKIFIVCPRLCHGGAERVGVTLANGMHGKGHDVTVLADLFEPQTYQLDEGIKIRNLVPQTGNKGRKWGGAVLILRRWLKRDRPDVIIGVLPLCSFVSRLAAMGLNIPVIATEHGSFERPADALMSRMERFSKFYLNKIYRVVTVLTEADKRVIGDRLKHVVVMPNPLCLTPIREDELTAPRQKVVLAAGRVDDWHYKGFDLLMKAWGQVMRDTNLHDWKLQIAGVWRDARSKAFLESIAREAGCLESLEFLGFQDDMLPVYRRASVFVLSSRYEGFGLVLIEAMSQGCACVAADYKGRQSEIITNPSEGITCSVEDVSALASGMLKMMTDDQYREQVRLAAVKRSEYYSITNSVERWGKLINEVVK